MYDSFVLGEDPFDFGGFDDSSSDDLSNDSDQACRFQWLMKEPGNGVDEEEDVDSQAMDEDADGDGDSRMEEKEEKTQPGKDQEGRGKCYAGGSDEKRVDEKGDSQNAGKELKEYQTTPLDMGKINVEQSSANLTVHDSDVDQQCPDPINFEEVSTETEIFQRLPTTSEEFTAGASKGNGAKANREKAVTVFDMVKKGLSHILPTTRLSICDAKRNNFQEEEVHMMLFSRKEEVFTGLDV